MIQLYLGAVKCNIALKSQNNLKALWFWLLKLQRNPW